MSEAFEAEEKAQLALVDLMSRAREVKRLFEEASVPMPPTLRRLFDSSSIAGDKSKRSKIIISYSPPPRPQGAREDWISVPISELTVSTLLLGVLRENAGPMDHKARQMKMEEYNPEINYGSALNAGNRLAGEHRIDRTDDGWKLKDINAAPIFYEGNAWGPVDIFQPPEKTAHRRQLILSVLESGGPMQVMQILRLVQGSGQCKVPIDKDSVKGDLNALESELKVSGGGRPRKWRIKGGAEGKR